MAVSLDPPVPGERVSRGGGHARPTCGRSTCSTTSTTTSSRSGCAVARPSRRPSRARCSSSRARGRPACCCCSKGRRRRCSWKATAPSRSGARRRPPGWRAIAVLTGGPLGVRMQAETDVPRGPDRAGRLPPPGVRAARRAPSASCARSRPVMSRVTEIEQNRERLASLGTMAAGLAHELNNPAAAAQRAAAQMAEALDVVGSTIDTLRRLGGRARAGRAAGRAAARGARGRPRAATALEGLEASDAEDELLATPGGARGARALAARGAAGGGGGGAGVARPGRRAGRAGHRGGAWPGWRPRSPRAASWRSSGSPRADVGPRGRREDLRLHGPRRPRRGGRARGPQDDPQRARPPAEAHRDQDREGLRSRRCPS